jgi:hypothetical protein
MSDGSQFFSDSESESLKSMRLLDMPTREFLDRVTEQFREAENFTKRRRDSSAQKILYAFLGKMLVDENEEGLLEEIELEEGEVYASTPIMGAMMRMLLKERLKSNPGFYYYRGNGDIQAAAVARVCNAIVNDFSGPFFNAEFEQADHLALMAWGSTVVEVKWNPDAGPAATREDDQTAERREVTPAESRCPECGHRASAELDDEACPEQGCKGRMQMLDGVTATVEGKSITYRSGALEMRLLNGFSFNTQSSRQEWHKVLWAAEDTIDDIAVLASDYPHAALADGSELDAEMVHLRRMRSVERAGAGISQDFAMLREASESLSSRERYKSVDYIKPLVYAGFATKPGDMLPGQDEEIEEGTLLSDLFPNGIRVVRVGRDHVEWEDVNLHERLVFGRREIVPGALWGKSVEDALECQYNLDEIGTILLTYANEAASPTMFYDEALVPEGFGVGGRPSNKIPAGKRPRDVSMQDLVVWAPPGQLGQAILAMPQMIKEDMQMILGAFSPFGSSLPQAAEGTATGMSITAEAAASQQALVLTLVALTKSRVVELGLKLFNRNADEERIFRVGGPYTSLNSVLKLKKEDVPEDVRVVVRKNSAFPRELYQQQASLELYNQAVANAAMAKQALGERFTYKERQYYAELYQVDLDYEDIETSWEIAHERIKRALDVVSRIDATAKAPDQSPMLTPDEMQAILTSREELIVSAQQMVAQQMTQGAPVDPATGTQPPVDPAMVEQRVAMIPPPTEDVVIAGALDKLIPLREEFDDHAAMADYIRHYAGKTFEGRNLEPAMETWLTGRVRHHDALAAAKQAQMVVGQQGALMQAMMPLEEEQALHQGRLASVQGAMASPTSGQVNGQSPVAGTRNMPTGKPGGGPPQPARQKPPSQRMM